MRKTEVLTGRIVSIAFGIERKETERKVPEQYEEALKFSVITHCGDHCSFCSFKIEIWFCIYIVNICGMNDYLFLESVGFIRQTDESREKWTVLVFSLLSVLALLETVTECWLNANE